MKKLFYVVLPVLLAIMTAFPASGEDFTVDGHVLAPPVKEGVFVRPAEGVDAQPVWGFADGIRIGLPPLGGPRGLIRIYAEYLGLRPLENVNFIALEPAPLNAGYRHGYSELESSSIDGKQGKIFISSDTPDRPAEWDMFHPARGVISEENGVSTLTVWIFSEAFNNGSKVYVRIKFRADKPYQFEIAGFADDDSVELEELRMTATMGNKMRLRKLYLSEGRVVKPADIWDYDGKDFAPRHYTPASDLITDRDGNVYAIAATDEKNPAKTKFPEGSAPGWFYLGKPGTQYWYATNPTGKLRCTVNARCKYWAIFKPIPGGLAYENFDMVEPFVQGHPFTFGITPQKPERFIRSIMR